MSQIEASRIFYFMTTKKTESWADKFARAKKDQFEEFLEESFSDEALKDVELFEVKVAGLPFKCRRLDQEFIANSGVMPMSLTEQIVMNEADTVAAVDPEERWSEMSPAERRNALVATARIVRYICVEPRVIVGDVGNRQNAISSDALSFADVNTLVSWAKDGGGASSGVKTFRRKRR